MRINGRLIVFWLILAAIAACKKPYNPPVINSTGSYLVVEGVINMTGQTTIKLSRTVNLASATTTNPVTNAVVSIQDSQNGSYPLSETAPGTYQFYSPNLDKSLTYRLNITVGGNQYASDFVPAKTTPPIDSVGFNITTKGVMLYVNTHDPANNTRYYRWDYNETWKFHSEYLSDYISTDAGVVPRTPGQYVYYCFSSDTASDIILGSSARLSQDVIFQNPLTAVAPTSEKIETEYSIQVNQYALTSDAFSFWTNLKKNTEQMGSIFDAQPSNLAGNIHNIKNAAEVVIGYISACSVQTKRIFINQDQLPNYWMPTYPYECQLDSEYVNAPRSGENMVKDNLTGTNLPLIPTEQFYINGFPAGYLASDVECIDCRIRGTQKQPAFWK